MMIDSTAMRGLIQKRIDQLKVAQQGVLSDDEKIAAAYRLTAYETVLLDVTRAEITEHERQARIERIRKQISDAQASTAKLLDDYIAAIKHGVAA